MDGNITNIRFIIDNTQMLNNLRAFMQSGSSSNADNITHTLFLEHSVNIAYKLSDRWFIMTVTFACLNFLALVTLILLFIVYKKKKREHIEFRSHKERWLKYDNLYKNQRLLSTDGNDLEDD